MRNTECGVRVKAHVAKATRIKLTGWQNGIRRRGAQRGHVVLGRGQHPQAAGAQEEPRRTRLHPRPEADLGVPHHHGAPAHVQPRLAAHQHRVH
jgi:hypothetical protein